MDAIRIGILPQEERPPWMKTVNVRSQLYGLVVVMVAAMFVLATIAIGKLGLSLQSMMLIVMCGIVGAVALTVVRGVNEHVSYLIMTLRAMRGASHTLVAKAREVDSGMETIAATTQVQEVVLDSIAARLEEAATLMNEAGNRAQPSGHGGDSLTTAMGGVVHNVVDLANAANAMRGVLEVMKEVSEQLGLLSLNAAIEAARAGDAGRGFGVVADEVRKLADGTSMSANDIAKLVGNLHGSLQKTIQALDGVGGAMDDMKGNASNLVGTMGQQVKTVEGIGQSMEEFRAQAARVRHHVREVQEASEVLVHSVEGMNGQTGRFKV